MDNKLLLIFILLFLSFLLLFYYLKLKTNIIMLLSIIIVLCINKLIVQKEYFNDSDSNEIHNELIDHMISTKPSKEKTSPFSFYGSESGNTKSHPNATSKATFHNILKSIKKGILDSDEKDEGQQDTPSTFRFSESISPPSTSSIPTTIV